MFSQNNLENIMAQDLPWFRKWFNEDYLKLYCSRDRCEASAQVDFLIHAMDLKGNERILDLGCGAGRHTLEFASRGFHCTGVDLSEVLIKEGEKELKKSSNLDVHFIRGDMFQMKNLGIFDVVVNLFTSFGYFNDDSDNVRFFKIARDHLKKNGKFFLDFLHPFKVKRDLNLKPKETLTVEGETVEISKMIEGDIVVKTIVFANPKRIYHERVKLYTREKIESMLSANSLQVVDVWNDYKGNPWNQKGDRQLFYCAPK